MTNHLHPRDAIRSESANRPARLIAIGDIHGHARALQSLLAIIDPAPPDCLVFLGDYVDRGPDTRGVLDTILELIDSSRCVVITLRGNHEEMMVDALSRPSAVAPWLTHGGQAVLASYGVRDVTEIPAKHQQFLRALERFYETDDYFFLHANYAPNWRVSEHDSRTSFWLPLDEIPARHYSGKTAVLGHTPQASGQILDAGHVICIDTGCGFGGLLTAYDVHAKTSWQVTEAGMVVTRPQPSR